MFGFSFDHLSNPHSKYCHRAVRVSEIFNFDMISFTIAYSLYGAQLTF